jgi:diguanylate cyclase (GGDEF)-like protein
MHDDVLLRLPHRFPKAAVALLVALGSIGHAQSPAELEARLPSLKGLERARALSQLVDARKIDQPAAALQYGAEALKLFKTYPDPVANIVTLNELMWPHMTAGRYDSASFYADSARRFAERAGDRAGLARALSNLGSLAQRLGEPKRAADLFAQALTIQRALGNDREAANSLNNLGFVYSTDLADYAKSLSYHIDALSIRERLGEKAGIALSLNNIGIVYGRLRNYDKALEYFRDALELRRQLGNQPRIASTLNNMGDTYLDAGDLPHALEKQREALAIRETLNDRSAIALSHRNIGLVRLQMHQPDSAKRELLEAMRLSSQASDRGLAVQVRLGLSAVERATGTPARALVYAREALAIADSMQSRDLVRQAAEEIAASREAQGDLAEALRAYKQSKAVSDSIFSAETSRRIAALEQRFNDERRLHEIDSLKRSQTELLLEANQRAHERDSATAIAVLGAVIGFFLYRRRVERTRLAESLSMTDALTGLHNRRYVQETIEMDIAASVRRTRVAGARGLSSDDIDLAFLILDLDRFKTVNDTYGHAIGDQLLTQIGTALRATCRDSDVIARWGGDEFLVIARFTDRNQCPVTAERVRAAVERQNVTLADGRRVGITCSIGYALFPLDPATPKAVPWGEVVTMADRAAYAAKRSGGNCCMAANPAESGRLVS